MPKVTVITPTTGNHLLAKCIESVRNQTHKDTQHLVVVDGLERWDAVAPILYAVGFPEKGSERTEDVLQLPYSIGKDRWNGHRIYGSSIYIAEGDYIMFIDDDNNLDPNHIQDCLDVIEKGNTWAYTFRKIVDESGNFICNDNCESLGKWPSVLSPTDYFIDVNCYFLPKLLAVHTSPLWYRKFREPGQQEVDRVLAEVLIKIAPKFDTTYNYSLNYRVGNTGLSVQQDFFKFGNAKMLQNYNGKLPWLKSV